MMSDYSTAAAPSLPRRKSPISHTGGFTDLPSASGALNSEYNYEKDSSSSRKPIKRSERNRDRKRGKARDETKALQIYNKGSSSGLVVTKSDSTIQSTEQYEKVCPELELEVISQPAKMNRRNWLPCGKMLLASEHSLRARFVTDSFTSPLSYLAVIHSATV